MLNDLPGDLPTFLKRFGSDARCRAYLVRARWPAGFGCERCGHDQACSHKKRPIEECRACRKQRSILAGTIFEQTKSGLDRWFLAIYLVTASKGGISAMELKRQMGLPGFQRRPRWSARSGKGSYQTAWSWLHKIRRAMVRPARVEADETYAAPGRASRAAARRLPAIHLVFGLAKRWLLGTHHGAVSSKHLPAYLDEFVSSKASASRARRNASPLGRRWTSRWSLATSMPKTNVDDGDACMTLACECELAMRPKRLFGFLNENGGWGTVLRNALIGPGGRRAPVRHQPRRFSTGRQLI